MCAPSRPVFSRNALNLTWAYLWLVRMRSATDALSWGRDVRYGAVPKSASSASAAVVANSASRAAFHCLGSSSATSFIG